MHSSDVTCMFSSSRSDRDGIESSLAVGDQVAVAHDEASADTADSEILAVWQSRQIIQIQIKGGNAFGSHGSAPPERRCRACPKKGTVPLRKRDSPVFRTGI